MASQELKFYQIDAFTNKAFQGNSAAVVLLPQSALPVSDSLRQAIAMENNLSETAFVECSDSSDRFASCSRFRLRWFTPAIEVPLCGHATLAAAAALFFGECNGARQLAFDTLSGELVVTRQPSGDSAADPQADLLSMDLPLIQATGEAVPLGIGRGSALVKAAVGDAPVEEVLYAPQLRYLLVVLRDEGETTRQTFLDLKPNSQQLGDAHTGGQLVGVIVSMPGDGQLHDLYSRFFAPWAGIAEDPVTGSAHSVLGTYWAARLGKAQLRARQCSPRGGELSVDVKQAEGRVIVAGQAVTVVRGALILPESLE